MPIQQDRFLRLISAAKQILHTHNSLIAFINSVAKDRGYTPEVNMILSFAKESYLSSEVTNVVAWEEGYFSDARLAHNERKRRYNDLKRGKVRVGGGYVPDAHPVHKHEAFYQPLPDSIFDGLLDANGNLPAPGQVLPPRPSAAPSVAPVGGEPSAPPPVLPTLPPASPITGVYHTRSGEPVFFEAGPPAADPFEVGQDLLEGDF